MFFKINNVDFSYLVNSLKVGFETLVSDNSGRNASGDTVIDIVNNKVKLYVGFRHTTNNEMKQLLKAISAYVVNVSFLNPATNTISTITAYTSTPEPEYYTIQSNRTIFKPITINFIEL